MWMISAADKGEKGTRSEAAKRFLRLGYKNSTWLVLGGAAAGIALRLLGWS
jgi:hypothetical protein